METQKIKDELKRLAIIVRDMSEHISHPPVSSSSCDYCLVQGNLNALSELID